MPCGRRGDARTIRSVDPERAAVFLWAAWDGVLAAHLLPGGMGLSEQEFDEVLAFGRKTLASGPLRSGEAP